MLFRNAARAVFSTGSRLFILFIYSFIQSFLFRSLWEGVWTALVSLLLWRQASSLQLLSSWKYLGLFNEVKVTVLRFKESPEIVHSRKFYSLRTHGTTEPCNPDKVIFNLSSKPIPRKSRTLLAFGLHCKPTVWKLKFYCHLLCFKKFIQSVVSPSLPARFGCWDVKQVWTRQYKTYNASHLPWPFNF